MEYRQTWEVTLRETLQEHGLEFLEESTSECPLEYLLKLAQFKDKYFYWKAIHVFLDRVNMKLHCKGHADTLLKAALLDNRPAMVKEILRTGVIAFPCGKRRWDALLSACKLRNLDLIKELLSFGADPYRVATDLASGSRREVCAIDFAIQESEEDVIKTLLDFNDGRSKPDTDGYKGLLAALSIRDADRVKVLLEHGVKPDKTALTEACFAGDVRSVRLLLLHGADPLENQGLLEDIVKYSPHEVTEFLFDELLSKDDKEYLWQQILLRAVVKGRSYIVEALLERGVDPNFADEDHFRGTPLLEACCKENAGVVKLLLRYGANPFVENDGISIMQKVCGGVKSRKIADVLLRECEFNLLTEYERNQALMAAIKMDATDVAIDLLENDASPHPFITKNGKECFPLMTAIDRNNREVASALLDRGANPLQPSHKGVTPLEYVMLCDMQAFMSNGWVRTETMKSYVSLFLSHYDGRDDPQTVGHVALSTAIKAELEHNVKEMLEIGISPNPVRPMNENSLHPLLQACKIENKTMINLLIKHDANPFLPDGTSETPISYVTRRQMKDECRSFLEVRLLVDNLDNYGHMAVSCAMKMEFLDKVKELVSLGISVNSHLSVTDVD